MKDALFTLASLVLVLATILAIDPARAGATESKPDEIHTIGTPATPDPLSAALRGVSLRKAGGSSRRIATEAVRGEKPAAIETIQPSSVASLNAAQRLKLASIAAQGAARAPEMEAVSKPGEWSTITAAAPGAVTLPAPELVRLKESATTKRTSPVDSPVLSVTGAPRAFGVLGLIPRPEWSARKGVEKSRDVTTIGPRETSAAPRPVLDAAAMQRRAAATVATPAAPKPAAVKMALPRDAGAPSTEATKSTTASETQEVRP